MAIIFALESLKFYKMKNQRFVAVFFLIVMAAVFTSLVVQVGDPNLEPLYAAVQRYLTEPGRPLPDAIPLNKGNWIHLGYLLTVLAALELLKYLFAASFVAEVEGREAKTGMLKMLRYLPSTLLLLFISAIIMGLSAFLLMIPYFWFTFATYFAPLLRAERGEKFFASLESSYQYTKGNKFLLFAATLLLTLALRFIEPMLRVFAPSNLLSIRLISAFFMTISMLIQGRFMGITYIYFVKVFPRMAGSFGYKDPRSMFRDIEEGKSPEHPEAEPFTPTPIPYGTARNFGDGDTVRDEENERHEADDSVGDDRRDDEDGENE